MKSRWHSPYILVFKDPLLTYLLDLFWSLRYCKNSNTNIELLNWMEKTWEFKEGFLYYVPHLEFEQISVLDVGFCMGGYGTVLSNTQVAIRIWEQILQGFHCLTAANMEGKGAAGLIVATMSQFVVAVQCLSCAFCSSWMLYDLWCVTEVLNVLLLLVFSTWFNRPSYRSEIHVQFLWEAFNASVQQKTGGCFEPTGWIHSKHQGKNSNIYHHHGKVKGAPQCHKPQEIRPLFSRIIKGSWWFPFIRPYFWARMAFGGPPLVTAQRKAPLPPAESDLEAALAVSTSWPKISGGIFRLKPMGKKTMLKATGWENNVFNSVHTCMYNCICIYVSIH